MHRGDSDWHGWDLQFVIDTIAEKHYAQLRESWPTSLDAPETLADFAKRGYQASEMARQIRQGVLESVVEVLDVVNTMDHPVVTELSALLTAFDMAAQDPISNEDYGIVAADFVADVRALVIAQEEA